MSTQTVLPPWMDFSSLNRFAGSRATRATNDLVNTEITGLRSTDSAPILHQNSLLWLHAATVNPTSRIRKTVALALVFVIHAAVILAFKFARPESQPARAEPLQVVMLSKPKNHEEFAPSPPTKIKVEIAAPIEPEIKMVASETPKSITIATSTEDTPGRPHVASPKVVSSVEYIREPEAKLPPAARALKQRGTVILRALIGTDGQAQEVNVHRSSGFR